MSIETARQAALTARQDAALDKRYRDRQTGRIYTLRGELEAGAYGYRIETEGRDGKRVYGFIEHADVASALADAPEGGRSFYPGQDHPLQALQFAAYIEVPKLAFDYAEELLSTVTVTPHTFTVERLASPAELAHLFGE